MLTNEALEQYLRQIKDIEEVKVEGDGYHYHLTIISEVFKGKSLVTRQQWVYSQIKHFVVSGEVRAVRMQTWTKAEWESKHG